jgi:SAM-dependent methyltransferase
VSQKKHKLARSRTRLLKQLAPGFVRAIFARPQGQTQDQGDSGDGAPEEVIEGPGAAPLDEIELALLFEQAIDAANRGLVKQSWVLAGGDQLNIDARHGFIKRRKFEQARIDKAMAGKNRPLRPDTSAPLLRALGIMKSDGSIPAKKAKKYKQVNHLVELAKPTLEHLAGSENIEIVDLACGNAYLSFVLAETLRLEGRQFELLGIDNQEKLVTRCRARAAEFDWPELNFESGDIESFDPKRLNNTSILLALHACDTASDAAIVLGLRAGVPAMWIVPCCHAQLAAQLDKSGGEVSALPFPSLRTDGLLRRAYAECLTDSLRVEVLRACGYDVKLVEFVGSEHTPKNLLIRAHRSARAGSGRLSPLENPAVIKRLETIRETMEAMKIRPALLAGGASLLD